MNIPQRGSLWQHSNGETRRIESRKDGITGPIIIHDKGWSAWPNWLKWVSEAQEITDASPA